LNNNNGYDKIKVANGIQQRSYISFFWSKKLKANVAVLQKKNINENIHTYKIIKIN
jgi:hypothetical protein